MSARLLGAYVECIPHFCRKDKPEFGMTPEQALSGFEGRAFKDRGILKGLPEGCEW